MGVEGRKTSGQRKKEKKKERKKERKRGRARGGRGRGRETKHVRRGFRLGGWDHKVTTATRISKINVFHLIKFGTNLMISGDRIYTRVTRS
jgi:hypothetical protein